MGPKYIINDLLLYSNIPLLSIVPYPGLERPDKRLTLFLPIDFDPGKKRIPLAPNQPLSLIDYIGKPIINPL